MTDNYAIKRRDEITKLILDKGSVSVNELSKSFSVSTETIRKDLNYLDKQGVVKKGRGCAIINNDYYDQPVQRKATTNHDEKEKIAAYLASIIPDGATVYLGIGSIPLILSKLLRSKKKLRVLTCSIPIAYNLLGSDVTLTIMGGVVFDKSYATAGTWALEAIRKTHVDYAILSTSGIRSFDGPTCRNYSEMEIGREIIKHSSCNILACDHSKFETDGIYQYAEWKDIDQLITTKGADVSDLQNKLEIILL